MNNNERWPISIIHPSRGRAKKALETANKWIENAGVDISYILSIDEDDNVDEYEFIFGKWFFVEGWKDIGLSKPVIRQKCVHRNIHKNRSAIDAINNAAKNTNGKIIIVISDDFDCPLNWGRKIISEVEGKTDWILKTPDGIQPWIITLPIMDRAYYNRFGYIYHPDYQHMFCDTEMSCVADLTGRRITANIPFKHNHYSIGGMTKDAISERADKTWEQGEKLFLSRYRQNFGLIDTPGRIQDQGMLNWIKSKGL